MFKSPERERKTSAAHEFEKLIELKNFDVRQSILEEKPNLKAPLLGQQDEVGRAQQRLNARSRDADVQKPEELGFFAKLKESFSGPKISTESRIIHFDQRVVPLSNFENIVRNQKYSVLTLIPLVLYNQFRFFFNFFFLMIAVSQAVDALKVGFLFTYVGPLVFVLALTTVKEGYDDYKRYIRDKEANSQCYKVLKTNNVKVDVPSSNLKVGDIIEVHANQRIPADLLLLYTSDESESVFIRTDQLDGETDWKLRKPIRYTQTISKTKSPYGIRANVQAGAPNQLIYDFVGVFRLEGDDSYKESLSLENTMWANTVLASGIIYGLILYTGKETRMAMNSKAPRTKFGALDLELNRVSKLLFGVMMALALVILLLRGIDNIWYIHYFKYMLLLSSIIPISMRINLDFAKALFSYRINIDKDIPDSVARNSTIPEELGRIQYLLTDKTGTLTQNDMIFKKLCLERGQYTEHDLPVMKKIIKKQCSKSSGPAKDVEEKMSKEEVVQTALSAFQNNSKKKKYFKRDKEAVLRDLITALILCHNVTPVTENGEKFYQASSPDEIALVKIAESLDMSLLERTQTMILIKNAHGVQEKYKILANFPFSSETKRMGIILRHLETNRIIFYLKGADTIMKHKIPEFQRGTVQDEVDELAKVGLRTLIITQKVVTEKEFKEWYSQYEEANTSLENREANVRKVVELLEFDMEFLGITGVEDKLQEDVNPTIESLREAGINVWMLTGDKVETAICIAISAGFKSAKQEMFVMRDITDPIEIQNQLAIFNNKLNCVLIIDGATLQCAMEYHKKYFFDVAGKAPAVVCCRCSPTQKADVTNSIKEFTGKKTCAIGDGGNDVGMIQASDVGVGIVGKEGKQAALAADFSIMKFKYVKTLMLWHGRNAYKRTAVMSQFVIHRGLIISLIQQLFSLIYYYVDMQYYNGFLMLGYATAFTSFPIFCIVLDHDVTKNVALTYSPLYKSLQKGRELNTRTFCFWVWKSIYQATIITLLPIALFQQSLREYTTLTFTALICNELLNVLSEVNKMSWVMFVIEILTAGSYFGSLILWPDYFDVSPFVEPLFWRLALLNLLSWLPLHVAKMIWHKWDPSDNQKIMRRAKIMEQIAEQENVSNKDTKIKIISIFNKIGDKVPFRKKNEDKKNEVPHQRLPEEEEVV